MSLVAINFRSTVSFGWARTCVTSMIPFTSEHENEITDFWNAGQHRLHWQPWGMITSISKLEPFTLSNILAKIVSIVKAVKSNGPLSLAPDAIASTLGRP